MAMPASAGAPACRCHERRHPPPSPPPTPTLAATAAADTVPPRLVDVPVRRPRTASRPQRRHGCHRPTAPRGNPSPAAVTRERRASPPPTPTPTPTASAHTPPPLPPGGTPAAAHTHACPARVHRSSSTKVGTAAGRVAALSCRWVWSAAAAVTIRQGSKDGERSKGAGQEV